MRRFSAPSLACIVIVGACGGGAEQSRNDGGPHGDAGSTLDAEAGADAAADAPHASRLCNVAFRGKTAGAAVITGRLLLPAGPTPGELYIGASGTIVCAAASCASAAGYASATRVECPGGVISPGLVNAHDHTEFATRAPEGHGTIRYQYRNDWEHGADGATPLPTVSYTSSAPIIAAQELRLVLGGGTSVVGTGGVQGLARNLAYQYDMPEDTGGLSGQTVEYETFPLGNDDATVISKGCAFPDIILASQAFAYGAFVPHLAEGINLGAENEIHCASLSTNDLVTKKTSIIHGVAANANDVAGIAKAGAKLIWSPRSNVSLYGNTAPLTEYRYAGVTVALGTDWLPSGSMNMLR
jgi:imidazolonepropionase-like amidohydrolase